MDRFFYFLPCKETKFNFRSSIDMYNNDVGKKSAINL